MIWGVIGELGMDFTNMEITASDKIVRVNGAPSLFVDRPSSNEHRDGWIHVPLAANLEGNGYANSDDEDHNADATINYDCIAWSES
jgi:hypothetical protein